MVCRCRDGTYGPHCCKTKRGRRNTSRRNSREGGPNFNPRASGAASRRMTKLGKALQQVGFAQISNSYLSMPPSSGKIWTYTTKQQAFDKRSSQYGYSADMRKNPRKYDFRPKGEALTFEGRNSPVYDPGQKKLKGREAHWARRPVHIYGPNAVQSQLSRPTVSEIHHHRKSQLRRGQFKVAFGTGLRTLGRGLLYFQLGTYAWWLWEDPSTETVEKIAKDITLYEQIESIFIDPIRNFGSTPAQ